VRKSKVNKNLRKKNYNTLDPLDIQRESFEARRTVARSKRYLDKYRVIELFSIGTNGRLLECGNILLQYQLTLPKTSRPKMRVLQYDWKLVLWWKQWERWVLFDTLSYETKMSKILRKQFPGENLLVFIKKIGFLFDPQTYVVKVVDVKTRECVLTNPVILATTFRRKRKVSTLFADLDVLPESLKTVVEAKDIFRRSKNVAHLQKEVGMP